MNRTIFLVILFWIFALGYTFLSYSLTDPNLVLINHPVFWQFQDFMWQHFFLNSVLLTQVYLFIITGWFVVFLWLIYVLKNAWSRQKLNWKLILVYILIISPLLFSYNALSHDVFNYIFNAKIVMVYDANPHQKVALDYAFDNWTRFMHNTHTPAPYGYGWTGVSLLPYMLGGGKFVLTWLSFRLFSVISLFGLLGILVWASKTWFNQPIKLWSLGLVFLNPLVLIEVIGNAHNDLWMMVPAVVSLLFFSRIKSFSLESLKWLILGLLSLIFSISIKYATLALLPLVIFILVEKSIILNIALRLKIGFLKLVPTSLQQRVTTWFDEKLIKIVPLIASILMFMPLLTSRSQQFHPWYLLWPLIWLPLIKQRWWWQLMIVFSISSLWRYAPWILSGGFEGDVLLQQKMITWLPAVLFVFFLLAKRKKGIVREKGPKPLKEISDQI